MKFFGKEQSAKRLVALVLLLAVTVSLVLSACNGKKPEDGATADSATTDAVDTMNFIFADGIVIAGANVGGMAYDAAFQEVEAVAPDTIKDFELKVVAEEKEFSYGKTDFEWEYDIVAALNEAAKYCESNDTTQSEPAEVTFDLKAEVKADSVTKVVDDIAKEVDVAAVDSTFSVDGDSVTVSREKAGRQIDKADLTAKITDEANVLVKGTKKTSIVEAVINDVSPTYKFESLDGNIELIATYSTWSTNTANGNHNMKLALEACNGSVINPGEVWSFNECTGNSNLTSLGYLPATVIINGEFEQGIGGGLCQSSSTIYNAAILANMTIEERYCHQYQSSYVPAGRDATIDYPYLDLKLSNPTDYPMYMQCYMEGTQLTVNIYGWNDPAFDYIDIESSVYGATEEGYRASAWRVYYLDDKEIGREELHSSWYDYPEDDEDETTKATKPKETKPKETKPKTTKPKATQPQTTAPQATTPETTVASDPVEVTTAPVNTEATDSTSQNDQQIETATAHY